MSTATEKALNKNDMKKDLENCKIIIEESKIKLIKYEKNNALLKTRVINLNNEVNDYTEKLKIMVDQSDNTEKLITALKNELI